MCTVIKQILPIPEGLTAMTRSEDDNGKKYYLDAIAQGETVFYALVEEDDFCCLSFYTADAYGIGELDEHDANYVMLTPTVHCQKCGRRMLATTSPKAPTRVKYRCICGETFDDKAIWDILNQATEVNSEKG